MPENGDGRSRQRGVAMPLIIISGLGLVLFLALRTPSTHSPEAQTTERRQADTSAVRMPARELTPDAWMVYLVDLSASVEPSTTNRAPLDSPLQRFLQRFDAFLTGMQPMLEADTQRSIVLLIGDGSTYQQPICTITTSKGTIFNPGDSAKAHADIASCKAALQHAKATPFTDIRGALWLAGKYLAGKAGKVRGIVVVSDFIEDLPPGTQPATPSLDGVCVALLPIVTPAGATDPNLIDERQRKWGRLTTSWGARVNLGAPATIAEPADLLKFFGSCWREQQARKPAN